MTSPLPEGCLKKCERAALNALPEFQRDFANDSRYADHPWLLALHASGTYQVVQGDVAIPVHQPAVAVPIKPDDRPEAIARALAEAWAADVDRMSDWLNQAG